MTDYQEFTTKQTTKSDRRRLGVGDIWLNSAQCKQCKEIIRSRNQHHFVTCSCGAVSVDGGSWYRKRSLRDGAGFEDLSEMYDDVE
jgi:hypothetical protein